MEEEIKFIKLKKNEKINDRSGMIIKINEEIKSQEWFIANMEVWYPTLEDFTIKTEFILLTEENIRDIIIMYEEKEESESIKKLKEEIDEKIKKFGGESFIKLSCRSPKDATVESEKLKEIYNKRIKEIDTPTDNEKAIILYQAHIDALKVSSSDEIFELFLKSGKKIL
jgi:hypothetical protein